MAEIIQKLQLLQQALLKIVIYWWSRLCISSRIRSANCCISMDPSICMFRSAVATRIAGLRGVQTPWSSSKPDTSICSPEWMEALSATATSQDRLLLTHFQHTRWSLSQMEHSPVGACVEVSQASQKALLHMPQRSQGAGLSSEDSSKAGLVCTAKAALAPLSTNLRVLGSFMMLTSGCCAVQPLTNCCIATKSTGANAIAWKQDGWKWSWDHWDKRAHMHDSKWNGQSGEKKNSRLQFSPLSQVSSRCCLCVQRGSHLDVDIRRKKKTSVAACNWEKHWLRTTYIIFKRNCGSFEKISGQWIGKSETREKKNNSWAVNLWSFPLWTHCLTCAQVMATPIKRGYWKWSDISKGVPSPCDPDWSSAETKVGKPPSRMEGRL